MIPVDIVGCTARFSAPVSRHPGKFSGFGSDVHAVFWFDPDVFPQAGVPSFKAGKVRAFVKLPGKTAGSRILMVLCYVVSLADSSGPSFPESPAACYPADGWFFSEGVLFSHG